MHFVTVYCAKGNLNLLDIFTIKGILHLAEKGSFDVFFSCLKDLCLPIGISISKAGSVVFLWKVSSS